MIQKIHYSLSDFPFSDLPEKTFVLTDENTAKYCLPLLRRIWSVPEKNILCAQSGERHKTLLAAEKICKELLDRKADRHSVLICLSGGLLCDLGGFAASVYKRGIRLIYIPTTLLAMCDASVGGKTGVNYEGLKNMLGTFYPAETIITDSRFLNTLPENEVKSGYAEMIKHSLLLSEKDFQEICSLTFSPEIPSAVLRKSIEFKQNITEQDPEERNIRKILNYGHTVGHGIEAFFAQNSMEITHGACVIAGIIIENIIAEKKALLDNNTSQNIQSALDSRYPRILLSEENIAEVAENMTQDKKNKGTSIQSVMLSDYGKPLMDVKLSREEILYGLRKYCHLI